MAAAYRSAIGPGLLVPRKPAVREGVEPERQERQVSLKHWRVFSLTHTHIETCTCLKIFLYFSNQAITHALIVSKASMQICKHAHTPAVHTLSQTNRDIPLTTAAAAAAAAIGPYAVRGMAEDYTTNKTVTQHVCHDLQLSVAELTADPEI